MNTWVDTPSTWDGSFLRITHAHQKYSKTKVDQRGCQLASSSPHQIVHE